MAPKGQIITLIELSTCVSCHNVKLRWLKRIATSLFLQTAVSVRLLIMETNGDKQFWGRDAQWWAFHTKFLGTIRPCSYFVVRTTSIVVSYVYDGLEPGDELLTSAGVRYRRFRSHAVSTTLGCSHTTSIR